MHLVAPTRRRTVSLLVLVLIASLIPVITAQPARAAAPGDIVITEVMKHPTAVPDTSGEWFEVHNTTSSEIDLANWTVSDGGTETFKIDGTMKVAGGGYAVIGNNDDPGTNGGVTVNFTYDRTLFFLDDVDALILRGPASQSSPEIDRVVWDDGATFPNTDGASMSLDPDFLNTVDNDDGSKWCAATSPLNATDFGTPGAANDQCDAPPPPPPPPPPVELVINEIMRDPAAVDDGAGEWFEIYNPTSGAVDIDGWTVRDNGTDSHVIDNGGPLIVPASGYIVLGNNEDTAINGGVAIDYDYGSDLTLDNGADELILLDTAMVESDRVQWDDGVNWPHPTGASMTLADPGADNNDGTNWCAASSAYGGDDLGTPGAANDSCAPPPPAPAPRQVSRHHHHHHPHLHRVYVPKPKLKWHWHRSHSHCSRF